jgi:hypothetical protein
VFVRGKPLRHTRRRIPVLVTPRPAEAGPARRETTDPPIAPHAVFRRKAKEPARRTKQGREPRARVQGLEAEWLAEVGRTHRDTHPRGRVPSPREVVVGVERARRHERGRNGVRVPYGIFYRTPQRIRFVRESVRAPVRRKAFWIVRMCAPHRACARRSWLVGESRTTGNGSGGELTSRMEPRSGACE